MAHFEPDQVIVRQGDPADAFYVLIQGEAQLVRTEADGAETELVRLHRGDTFGEAGLLRHQRRDATVRAVSPVDVLVVGSSDFDLLAGTWKHLGNLLAPGTQGSAESTAGMAQVAETASSPPA